MRQVIELSFETAADLFYARNTCNKYKLDYPDSVVFIQDTINHYIYLYGVDNIDIKTEVGIFSLR